MFRIFSGNLGDKLGESNSLSDAKGIAIRLAESKPDEVFYVVDHRGHVLAGFVTVTRERQRQAIAF